MPKILDRILASIKEAMKAREGERLIALRTLHAEIKNLAINERRELSDADVAAVIAKAIKQRNDAREIAEKAGRTDIAAREQFQIDLYSTFLPRQLSREEIEGLADEAISKTGASSPRDMGRVMKELMAEVRGRAEGKIVSEIVSRKLKQAS